MAQPFVNSGLKVLCDLLVGAGTAFNAANARIGVGNGTTAWAAGQTDLSGGSKVRLSMAAGYPQHTAGTDTANFRVTAGANDANFAWQEFALFNASSGGNMLFRVVENNGTKVAGQIWEFEIQVQFTQ